MALWCPLFTAHIRGEGALEPAGGQMDAPWKKPRLQRKKWFLRRTRVE